MAKRTRREYKAPKPEARNPGLDEMPEDELVEGFDLLEEEDEDAEEATEETESPEDEDFYRNLAEDISPEERKKMARLLLSDIEQDKKSRAPWQKMLELGIKEIGVFKEDFSDGEEPFPGASTVHHPVMGQAVVQFNARAITELFPAGGPVKGTVVGEVTQAKEAQAKRVEDHMNYQLTEEDETYFDELDGMCFYLPIGGSAFKKVYRDTLQELNCSTFLKAEELIVNYTAPSLEKAPRITQEIFYPQNEMRKLQHRGFYLDVELREASDEPLDGGEPTTQSLEDTVDSREAEMGDDDARYVVYECHCEYDLLGFEDEDEKGEATGIALPYIISIDKDSEEILSIRRNWREEDHLKRRRLWFVHYKFLPGLGFYGFGFLHMIGDLCRAATGALRVLLDGAAFASLQGGFKSKDAKMEGGERAIGPGEWIDINMSAEELKSAFVMPPYKEPSQTMFALLGLLTTEAQRFASVTETMVGDSAPSGPVGTTVALIEQGSKVFSSIHKRMHRAQRREFKLLAQLNAEYLPDEYPYDVAGESRSILRQDYDARVDVLPVSDPNIFSSTQRIAQAQAVLQISVEKPGVIKDVEATRRMLIALNVPDVEKLINDPRRVPRYDPATESARIMAGKNVKAFQDQDHQSHLAVHMVMMELLKTMDEQQAQPMMMSLMEHMAKHQAYEMLMTVQQVTGVPIPPVDLYDDDATGMPPQVEMAVSQAVAQGAQMLAQFVQSRQPPPPEDAETQAKIKRKDAEFQQDETQKQQAFEAEQRRLDIAAAADLQRQGGLEGLAAEEARKQQEFQNDQARKDIAFKNDQARADAKLKDGLKGEVVKIAEEERKEDEFDAEEDRKHAEFLAEEKRKQLAAEAEAERMDKLADAKAAAAKKVAKATPKPKPKGKGNEGRKK